MDLVRLVRVPVDSDEYRKIGDITRLVRKRDNKYLFFGWSIQRIYSKEELQSAKLLLLKLKKTFEPAGEECGTIYEYKDICEICGSGIRQISDLYLDLRKVPRNTDIARTISNEIIIDQNFAEILNINLLAGYQLKPALHKVAQTQATRILKTTWYQLFITSQVNINPATKTGEDPFDPDEANNYRCKNGHTIGLDILSEPFINKNSWDGSDFVVTKEHFGVNRGLLRTYPLLLISQKAYQFMENEKCNGYKVEVVHLV